MIYCTHVHPTSIYMQRRAKQVPRPPLPQAELLATQLQVMAGEEIASERRRERTEMCYACWLDKRSPSHSRIPAMLGSLVTVAFDLIRRGLCSDEPMRSGQWEDSRAPLACPCGCCSRVTSAVYFVFCVDLLRLRNFVYRGRGSWPHETGWSIYRRKAKLKKKVNKE